MKVDQSGLSALSKHEGTRARAYKDEGGLWTIGIGHLIGDEKAYQASEFFNRTLATAEVMELFRKDIAIFEKGVSSAIKVGTTQNQFNALVSLAFNIGMGNFLKSTALARHNAGDFKNVPEAMGRYNKVRKSGELVFSAGLDSRRKAEGALYLGGK